MYSLYYLSYDMQTLIGEVGGTLGLLLGVSLIFVFDFFEYVVSSCYKKKWSHYRINQEAQWLVS